MTDTATIPKLYVRESVAPGKRKPLTRAQVVFLVIRQHAKCGCGCGAPLDPECIDEHLVPRNSLPADRADLIDNRALFNKPCARRKTDEIDAGIVAKNRRRRGVGARQVAKRERNGPTIKQRPTNWPKRTIPKQANPWGKRK